MTSLTTSRLRLEFVTPALARIAEHGRTPLEAALGARLHEAWDGSYVFRRTRRVLVDEAPIHALVVWQVAATVIGEVRFEPLQEGVFEIGYAIAAPFRRQGFATEAVGRLVRWLDQEKAARTIVAGCDMANKPSVRTLRRLGFELDGADQASKAFWWVWAPEGLGGGAPDAA
jgi:RimJ/RimL family protein N-acetyltransferase